MNNFRVMLLCHSCGGIMAVPLLTFHEAMRTHVTLKVVCDLCGFQEDLYPVITTTPPPPPPVQIVPPVKQVVL